MNEVYTSTSWIVTVDGIPTDIRGASDLATRQAKIRKHRSPASVVQLHYGECSSRTFHDGTKLVVAITAPDIGNNTLMATIAA